LKGDIAGAGTTEFHVLEVLGVDPSLPKVHQKRKGDMLLLPNYLPFEDSKKPPHYILFCTLEGERLDPYRGFPLNNLATIDYYRAALRLNPRDRIGALLFFFRHLDHQDQQIARDAFMEFVQASDREIGELARALSPEKLRRWLKDTATPPERRSLYAFMLGGCGKNEDAAWFQAALTQPSEWQMQAYDGLLGGFIQLRPTDGWQLIEKVMREGKQRLPLRLAIVRTMQFYMAWKPAEAREPVRRALSAMLTQGELLDLAVDGLRRWQMWAQSDQVLAMYGRQGVDAPIHKRAIIRFALCCPEPRAKAWVARVRQRDAELVREVEESIRTYNGS
jgi:hypothetical protein